MTMDAFTPNGSKPDPVWLDWANVGSAAVDIFEQFAGQLTHEQCQQRQWSMEQGRWRWRMPSVDDAVAAIPAKPWPAPPHPGPTETTEELGIRSVKGGYPEHQPRATSETIREGAIDPSFLMFTGSATRTTVFRDIVAERNRQDKKFGSQSHDAFVWLAILTEEVGEAGEAALHERFGGPAGKMFRTEVLHAAAVAVAILEDMERKGIK